MNNFGKCRAWVYKQIEKIPLCFVKYFSHIVPGFDENMWRVRRSMITSHLLCFCNQNREKIQIKSIWIRWNKKNLLTLNTKWKKMFWCFYSNLLWQLWILQWWLDQVGEITLARNFVNEGRLNLWGAKISHQQKSSFSTQKP